MVTCRSHREAGSQYYVIPDNKTVALFSSRKEVVFGSPVKVCRLLGKQVLGWWWAGHGGGMPGEVWVYTKAEVSAAGN